MQITKESLSSMIDHTLLKPEATPHQIRDLCAEAKMYHFASVCVNPGYVPLCVECLEESDVKVCTVIGFPLGATSTSSKVAETIDAIAGGAKEVDMVINVGRVKSEDFEYVRNDIGEVVEAAAGKALVKVIIETCLLDDKEKVKVCEIAKEAGADFVKTSTGFSTGGAKASDIALMRHTVGDSMGVKASGGIRTTKAALEMIEAGASRIGASASVDIVEGL